MNYLTQVVVGRTEAARRNIYDLYAWHQMVWQAFPEKDGEKRAYLFRVDPAPDAFRVFLLSVEQPRVADWGAWRTKTIAPGFLTHGTYRFQLKANPTMRRNSDRRRLPIYREDRLRDWMLRKAAGAGFEILGKALVVGAPVDEYFTRNRRRGKHVSVDFRGELSVTDRTLFQKAFSNGIGSAKAFGFGMLMLEPMP